MSGRIIVVTGTDQAAGTEMTHTVTAQIWRLRGIAVPLVTSAVAGARRVHMRVLRGGIELHRWIAADTQAASLTRNYRVGRWGFQPALVNTFIFIASELPLELAAGDVINTLTDAFDPTAGTGDNYGPPQFDVELIGGA